MLAQWAHWQFAANKRSPNWAWAWVVLRTSHGPLWAGVVCSPCSLRCRQFQFEILRSTRVGSKKWESLKIFTASQGRLREFYVTFYGADVTVTVTSRCCWHSSAGFRRQRQLTQFVLEMSSSSHCSKEMREFFELQLGQLTITQTTKTQKSKENNFILETSPWYDPILSISHYNKLVPYFMSKAPPPFFALAYLSILCTHRQPTKFWDKISKEYDKNA